MKSQVHTGGRGKAGGILRAATPQDIEKAATELFGKKLVTHQTGPDGVIIRKLYIEQAQTVQRELYAACAIDRSRGCPVLMASTEGGMEIEELARTKPDAILYEPVDPLHRSSRLSGAFFGAALGSARRIAEFCGRVISGL